jgi:hypothetical protein
METANNPGQAPSGLEFEHERQKFRALILANPNYFGNLKVSPFKPVLHIQSNTTFEELGCVGYQPQFNRLEAVVYIKQPTGYGGNVCSNGTPEYVRFYMSFDNGVTWQDLGLTSFTAYDIPGTGAENRLEYAVTLLIDPAKKLCFINNLCLVRAILSWNAPPPPNDPNFTPVWGNIHDTHVQIDPIKLIVLGDLLAEAKLKLPPNLQATVDLEQQVLLATPKELGAAELQVLYKDTGAEPHRFALAELQKLISQPALSNALTTGGLKALLPDLNFDPNAIIDKLFPVQGDTRFEQLECIGLDTNQDTLVGVLRIKLPFGYSGNPCTAGSREYVTFWGDFDNSGAFASCLGTTSVNVYDIAKIPKDGLEYAVFLPVNLGPYRQPCDKGPKVVKIRAILSWQVPPPCANPNFIPIWGNRLETLIQIKPGAVIPPDTHPPVIETVGSMGVANINQVTGLANGPALLAGFTAQDSPFGGDVVITGHVANPPDISSGAAPLKYRVSVSNNGGVTWQHLTNSFVIGRSQLLNGGWTILPNLIQSVDADDFYTYQEDLTDGPNNAMIFVEGNVLAHWLTGGLTGPWQIKVEAKDPANNIFVGATVAVWLDNASPVPSITITSGGGACADFHIGDIIQGTYSVSDEHFGSLGLDVEPALGGVFTSPVPLPRTYPTVPTTGESGIWKLDTHGMPRCGYVVRLSAVDRTIVNSGFIGFFASAVIGLCLREAAQ